MSEYKTTDEYIKASTQYNDVVGTAAGDGASPPGPVTPLLRLAELMKIDTETYFPISASFFYHEGARPFVSTSLFAVETKDAGKTADEVGKFIDKANGMPKVVQFTSQDLSPTSLLEIFKRFNVVLRPGWVKIAGMDIQKEV